MNDRPVPRGRQALPFGEIAESITERIDDPSSSGLDYYVGLEHLDPDALRISRWGSPSDVEATKLRFYPGDVIYARRRAYQRKLGVADWDGVCSAHALVLRARPAVCLPEFLPYLLQSDQFHQRALEISVGSLSPTINWRTLAVQEFILPEQSEQRAVVRVMSGFERYGDAHLDALDALRTLERSLVLEVRKSGSTIRLGELASRGGIQIGPFGSQLHAHEYVENGVPVVMPSNLTPQGLALGGIRRIREETAQRLAKHRVRDGDILLPRRGDLNKRALVTEQEEGWLCGTGSVRVRLDEPEDAPLVERLLAGASTIRWLESNAVGTTMPNLNTEIVSRIPLAMPSSELRHVFSGQLTATRSLLSALESAVAASRHARLVTLNRLLKRTG